MTPRELRRPPRRVDIFSLLVLGALTCASASAQDAGTLVHFRPALVAAAPSATAPAGLIVYDSGESEPILESWDTVLFQGISADAGAVFEVSRREPSGAWSPWVAASVKGFPNGRFWGRARLGPGPGALRVRAVVAGGGAPKPVEVWSVEVFETAEGEDSGVSAEEPAAFEGMAKRPGVFARREWKAAPPKGPYAATVPRRVTLHHTAGSRPGTLAESLQEVGFIQDFHQNGRGWNDIGYHFLIDASGNLFEGRPEGALGAHVRGHNAGNVGVAFLATHQAPKNHPVAAAQLDAFLELLLYLSRRYGMEPEILLGHRDYADTGCPGDLAYPFLRQARRRLANPPLAMGNAVATLPSGAAAAPAWDSVLP